MSVDKFGRHSQKKGKVRRGPRGEGFKLTPNGDYDIKGKRLQNVDDPVENGDAVNLHALHAGLLNCITLTSDYDYFDAQLKRISNARDPVEDSDLVTKRYMDGNGPLRNLDRKVYSFHQFGIKDVAYPENDGDAVNLRYIKNNCLQQSGNNIYDVNGGTIAHIRDPIHGSEAATKTYVDSKTPVKSNNYWTFGNKRLVNVANPINDYDAATLSYIKRNTLCMNSKKEYDAKMKVISNIAKPLNLDDAVSKRFLKEVLANLGYSVYTSVNKGRANLVPPEVWKEKVFDSTWDELFKLN